MHKLDMSFLDGLMGNLRIECKGIGEYKGPNDDRV